MTLFYVIWIVAGIFVAIDFCEDMWKYYKLLGLNTYLRIILCALPYVMCTICWPVWVINEIIEVIKHRDVYGW